jgi:hypothetical protein
MIRVDAELGIDVQGLAGRCRDDLVELMGYFRVLRPLRLPHFSALGPVAPGPGPPEALPSEHYTTSRDRV